MPPALPARADGRHSMGFARDTPADGRVLRALNIVDDCTRECPAGGVDTGSPGARAVRVPERPAAAGRRPPHPAVGNGPEFASEAADQRAARGGVDLRLIDPGKPMRNAHIESFSGGFRDGCPSQHWSARPGGARRMGEAWRIGYDERRPHRSFQHLTPAEFAAKTSSKQSVEPSL